VSKALDATARNLDADQDRGTYGSSKARLWVYDRRLELVTRAFTLFGARRSSGREHRRATSQHVVPWSPGDPGGSGPFKPGGDSFRTRSSRSVARRSFSAMSAAGGVAAVATTDSRRVVVTGFPIEAIPSQTGRTALLDAALNALAP
jgi:hypothetical protein